MQQCNYPSLFLVNAEIIGTAPYLHISGSHQVRVLQVGACAGSREGGGGSGVVRVDAGPNACLNGSQEGAKMIQKLDKKTSAKRQ
jgi:hypothetical protein